MKERGHRWRKTPWACGSAQHGERKSELQALTLTGSVSRSAGAIGAVRERLPECVVGPPGAWCFQGDVREGCG
jgi:hypothetical protein